VAEQVSFKDAINEADVICDSVHPMDNDADVQVLPSENMAMQFVALREDDMNERALEIEYLSALGIHVVDSTLPIEAKRIQCYHSIRGWLSSGGISSMTVRSILG
jgi:MinD-like ATPase involved in chromosome partitioning or flagellar assembly